VDGQSTARGVFDAQAEVDPRAVLWWNLHPEGAPCKRCPNCIGFPCLSKLQKIANHPALLQVRRGLREYARPARSDRRRAGRVLQYDPRDDQEKRLKTLRFAEVALPKEVTKALGGSYERSVELFQLAKKQVQSPPPSHERTRHSVCHARRSAGSSVSWIRY
jgi:hypothetical protein